MHAKVISYRGSHLAREGEKGRLSGTGGFFISVVLAFGSEHISTIISLLGRGFLCLLSSYLCDTLFSSIGALYQIMQWAAKYGPTKTIIASLFFILQLPDFAYQQLWSILSSGCSGHSSSSSSSHSSSSSSHFSSNNSKTVIRYVGYQTQRFDLSEVVVEFVIVVLVDCSSNSSCSNGSSYSRSSSSSVVVVVLVQ